MILLDNIKLSSETAKEIYNQLINCTNTIVNYTFCENYINSIKKYELNNVKFTLKTWNNIKDMHCYDILNIVLCSDQFNSILNKYNITPVQYNDWLSKNQNVERQIKKYIDDQFQHYANYGLFDLDKQLGKLNSPREVLNTLKPILKQIFTWEHCKKAINYNTNDKYYNKISITLDNVLSDLSMIITFIEDYSTFLKDNNISFMQLYTYIKHFSLEPYIIQYLINIFKQRDQEKSLFYKDNSEVIRYDPYEFYLRKDKIGDEQYSKRSPYEFSNDRTSPVILINDEVYTSKQIDAHHFNLLDDFKKKHNLPNDADLGNISAIGINNKNTDTDISIKNIAVGSNFNKVILLEYYSGNINEINATFLKHGFKKVYYNKDNTEIPNTYKRIAKLKRLYKLYKGGDK